MLSRLGALSISNGLRISRAMSTAAAKPFVLYAAKTPNGFQPTILLEELKAVYGASVDYECVPRTQRRGTRH